MNHLPKPSDIDFVIYHGGCQDGFAAAWSAWKLLENKAQYFAAYHDQEPPEVKGKNVAILDFAYSRSMMEKLANEANSLIVLDHHISNQEPLKDFPYAVFDMNKSGAMMSWNFFHSTKEPPLFIQYVQDRDLWKWSLPKSKEFSVAFFEVPFSFTEYDKFLKQSEIDRAIVYGSYIQKHTEKQVKLIAKGAVNRKLFGYNCKVVNSCVYRSELGHELAKQSGGIGVVWSFNHSNQTIRISFRSDDDFHNVAEVSKALSSLGLSHSETSNAGGHSRAAGFIMSSKYNIEDIFNFSSDILMTQNTSQK